MPTSLEFTLTGMHCAACSARIERVLQQKEAIASVTVSLATNTALVVLRDEINPATATKDIITAIQNLGFGAEPVAAINPKDDFIKETSERFDKQTAVMQADMAVRKKELLFALAFTFPLFFVSMGEMMGLSLPHIISPTTNPFYFALLQLALCIPVLIAGKRFYTNGLQALFRRSPNMDTLVALGTGAAFLYSLWETLRLFQIRYLGTAHMPEQTPPTALNDSLFEYFFGGLAHHGPELYFESAAMVIALVSVGKYMETRSKLRTGEAIKRLLDLTPETTTRLIAPQGIQTPYSVWKEEEITVKDVQLDNLLLIRPGGRFPVDGVVLEGESHVDESMLTGESMPVKKTMGDTLSGGTINQAGRLVMQTKHIGADTVLARIVRMVQNAQSSKAPIASLADTISLYFVPVVMVVALASGLFWFLHTGNQAFALRMFVSVLIIACPCAMGLATPMSIMVASGRGAQLGVLFKNGQALQKASTITTMIFDKTGTLTLGKPVVTDIFLLNHPNAALHNETTCLQLAAALETASEHPLARAIVEKAKKLNITLPASNQFMALPGKGAVANIVLGQKSMHIAIGNAQLVAEYMHAPDAFTHQAQMDTLADQGKTPVVLLVDGYPAALIAIADPLREETAATLHQLQRAGIKTIMLTGDTKKTAKAIAKQAGLHTVYAEVMPDEKLAVVLQQQKQGEKVGMVGDGINDAPALAQADVGFAVQSGTDIAMETGDVVLMRNGIAAAHTALALGKATLRNIRQNLFWAFAYNIIGIPFAAGVFYYFGGPTLSPMLAGAAMALSSVCVVTNSLRLRFFNENEAHS